MESYIVKKLVEGAVFYKVPGENKERTWKGDNSRLRIPFQELEDCMYDGAIRELFENGYLYVEDKDCRIALGLELEDDSLSNESRLVLEKDKLEKLLYEDSFEDFKSKVSKLGRGSLEVFISLAVNSPKQIAFEKSEYIRKTFHVDVVMIQRQAGEEKQGV